MNRSRRILAGLAAAVVAAVAALACALRRGVSRARDVPLSPLTAGWRVGADYPERRGIVTDGEVTGEMDDVSEYAGPEFDPEAVAPAVRAFYERTADYELAYRVDWHRPFRVGAALASRLTGRIEQLNLPGPGESALGGRAPSESSPDGSDARELESRFARVDPAADPRPGARAWVRTRPDGTAVFVAVYAHHERDGRRYVNIAVPLPGTNLSTVLRPENLESGADGPGGIELTTLGGPGDGGASDETADDETADDGNADDETADDENAGGDAGLYLVTPFGAVALPLDQRFRVRPADDGTGAPDDDGDASGSGGGIVATHEMWLFGRQFLTVRYAGRPRA